MDFLTSPPTDYSALKLCKLQHQCNNIVKTAQLTNDQMPEFYCQYEGSKRLPPAPSYKPSVA